VVEELVGLVERGHELAPGTVESVSGAVAADEEPEAILGDLVWRHRGVKVAPKTVNQKRYVDSIRGHTITFGIGPAGTGKTFLAVAMAVAALDAKEVSRIILTRPRSRPASAWASCRATSRRRSTHTSARSSTRSTTCSTPTEWRPTSTAGSSRWRPWRSCGDGLLMTPSSSSTRRRTRAPSR